MNRRRRGGVCLLVSQHTDVLRCLLKKKPTLHTLEKSYIVIQDKCCVYTMKGGVRVGAMVITIANPLSSWRKGFETEP